ncbi:hypothetical protein [Paenibacillus turpanensis]|uniref:hypothetical protein n=1 Tax=Paenibacillus turpanensis TaxID=2689078 RepID=UPI001408480C|nr:hypothetical protein [Paenibacillus turpanensis]
MNKLLLIGAGLGLLITVGLLSSGSGSMFPAAIPPVSAPISVPDDGAAEPKRNEQGERLLQSITLPDEENGAAAQIDLLLEQGATGEPLRWSLRKGEAVLAVLEQPDDGVYGAGASLETKDLDGDGRLEVLVYRYNTGTSGAVGLTAFQTGVVWKPIFAVDNPFDYAASDSPEDRFRVTPTGGFKAQLTDVQSGLTAMLPLDPKTYEGMDEQDLQKWLNHIGTWVDPMIEYTITDLDQDGKQEIVTKQPVIGFSHPDWIGFIEFTFGLGEDGVYEPVKEAFYDKDHELLKSMDL